MVELGSVLWGQAIACTIYMVGAILLVARSAHPLTQAEAAGERGSGRHLGSEARVQSPQ
jgi:uncharacterized membrane protein YecN with MAPEG domain